VVDVDLLAKREAERLAVMESRREGAYVAWIERKQEEHEKILAARGVITMSNKGFELADVRRVYDQVNLGDDAFKLVDKFMRDVAESQDGFIDPQHVQETLTQVSTQRRVDERVEVLKKQEKNDPRTKEEKAAERVKLKIGEQMLDLLSSGKNGRTLFGVVITSVAAVFRSVDADGSGRIDKDEFKVFAKRLDMGLNTQQMQDLWGSFDVDSDGSVSQGEFEGLLLDVHAQNALFKEADKEPEPIYALAGELQAELGDSGAEKTLLSIFGYALDKRLSANAKDSGVIPLWDFRTILRQVPMQGLTPFTRSNMLNVFDQLFRRLDHGKKASVRADDVAFFVRSASLKFNELSKQDQVESQAERRQKLLLRVGKTIWAHAKATMQRNGKAEDDDAIYDNFNQMLRHVDTEKKGRVTRSSFVQLFKNLQFTLTMQQEATIFETIDTDNSETIEHREFISFLRGAKKIMEKKVEADREAQDPRNFNMLLDSMLRDVSDKPSIMLPILTIIKNRLMGINPDATQDRGKGQRTPAASAGVAPSSVNAPVGAPALYE